MYFVHFVVYLTLIFLPRNTRNTRKFLRLLTPIVPRSLTLMELEKGRSFAVFPQAFNEMQSSHFVFYDLPEELTFNYHTMCACNSMNKNPEVRRVFSYIRKHKADFVF